MDPADPLGLSSKLFPRTLGPIMALWYCRAMRKYGGQGFETGKDLVGWSLIDGQVPGLMIQDSGMCPKPTGVRAAPFNNWDLPHQPDYTKNQSPELFSIGHSRAMANPLGVLG